MALVATNRQHVTTILTIDHRLRAQLAARAGLRVARARLRSDGPVGLSGFHQELQSGAHFQLRWEPYAGPPLAGSQFLLTSSGVSGFMQIDMRVVMQEMKISDDAQQILFGIVKGPPELNPKKDPNKPDPPRGVPICALFPDFRWRKLGQMQGGGKAESLTGGGGSVYTLDEKGGPIPPVLQDWTTSVGAGGFFQTQGFGPSNLALPQGGLAWQLQLQGTELSWKECEDPNQEIGSVTQATVDGVTNGQPRLQTFSTSGGPVTVDISEYRGPVVDWYTLEGPVMAASDKSLYCHATHTIFKGYVYQNVPELVGGALVNRGKLKDPSLISDNAVLERPEASSKWKAVCDCLSLPDPLSEPVVSSGPRPSRTCLAGSTEGIFCLKSDDPTVVLQAGAKGFTVGPANPSAQPWMVIHQSRLLLPRQNSAPGAPLTYQPGLLSMTESFPKRVRGVTLNVTDPESGKQIPKVLRRDRLYYPSIQLKGKAVSSSGKDLYLQGQLAFEYVDDPPGKGSIPLLLHHTGKAWDVWPSGLRPQLEGLGDAFHDLKAVLPGDREEAFDIEPDYLAVGKYVTGVAAQARYEPVGILP